MESQRTSLVATRRTVEPVQGGGADDLVIVVLNEFAYTGSVTLCGACGADYSGAIAPAIAA